MSVVKEKKGAAERSASGSFFQNLLVVGIYKRNQGRITRQVTFFAIVIGLALAAWRMHDIASHGDMLIGEALPAAIFVIGSWIAYRLVNMPSFADFLIAVEAEMGKVSWPTRTELMRGSVVVLLTIFILTAMLYLFDVFWNLVFFYVIHI